MSKCTELLTFLLMNKWKSVPYKAIHRYLMPQRKDRKPLNVEFLYLNKVAVVFFKSLDDF